MRNIVYSYVFLTVLQKRASVYQPIYSNNYVSLPTPQPSPISIKGDPMIPRNSHTSCK